MKPHTAYTGQADAAQKPKSDVQSLWRKLGWLPPSEYRQDFEQSCCPVIMAGMVRLELTKVMA